MNWLLEEPLFIVVVGGMTAAILGGIWLQTGRRPLLYTLCLVVVLTCSLVLLERTVQTDREQIEATLQQIARDVEANDLQVLLGHVHSTAAEIRRQAEAELPKYEFQRVSIKQNLEISVAADQEPKQAVATFNAVVVISDRTGLLKQSRVPRFVSVNFQKEGAAWQVIGYGHKDPQAGFKRGR